MPQAAPSIAPSPERPRGKGADPMARHGAAAEARQTRNVAFEAFRHDGPARIERIATDLPEMAYFRAAFSFYVAAVPNEPRQFHVFLGAQPYDSATVPGTAEASVSLLAERGGTLFYERLDTGKVLVLLYPAETKHTRQRDQAIVLKEGLNPTTLDDAALRRHLRWFAAYMADTTLDGAASVDQWLRVVWLRWAKPYVRNNEVRPPRMLRPLRWGLNWFFTVALSGWFIVWLSERHKAPDVMPGLMRAQTVEIARGTAALERGLATVDQHVVRLATPPAAVQPATPQAVPVPVEPAPPPTPHASVSVRPALRP